MPPRADHASLAAVTQAVVTCDRCPRLREYCTRLGVEKRAAFRDETYWAKPVPGFGDPDARVVLVGLAPAAHGANRTGRMFTGDGTGGSSDFLMAALHANGLASQPSSQRADDGLRLTDAWLTAAVRCAPPDNLPTPAEVAACEPHLRAELAALRQARVYVALGRLAFERCLRVLASPAPETAAGRRRRTGPSFAHGAVHALAEGRWLLASYHPSRQNTHTGRLTPAMLADVLADAVRRAATP